MKTVADTPGVVRRWGKGAAVRIPDAVMEAAHLRLDQQVVVREEAGRVVIEPILPKSASSRPASPEPTMPTAYDLEALLAGITDENRHDSVDMGPRAGQETW